VAKTKIIHTADWQLGKPFGRFPAEVRAALAEARLDAIDRIAAAASSSLARHVIVAGDVFDNVEPGDRVVMQAMSRMERASVTWWLMPGNHDHARAGGLWTRVRSRAPQNVRIVDKAEPLEMEEGAWRLGKNSASPTRRVFSRVFIMASTFHKTGALRQETLLLPARIEDYVGSDNLARAIEAFAASLDLVKLKFCHAVRMAGAGQPPYHPADLLKLYLYGYLNQIRSSRRLEREAGRNVELMWLLRGLVPGYRTIANFRRDNLVPLKQVSRDFVMLLRTLDLLGGEIVAIDGAFFDGNASKCSIVTRTRLEEQVAAVEREIAQYTAALDANDAAEAAKPEAKLRSQEDVAGKLAALIAKREAASADVAKLQASGQTQLSRTDADARLLSKHGQSVAGYNVQIAVDAKHKLIVAAEAVNDGNDTGQLHAMAAAACEALGVETLQAVADSGYFNGEALKACEDTGIEPFVPEPRRGTQAEKAGRFGLEAFPYDAEADEYDCPQGKKLRRQNGYKTDATGKRRIRYVSRRSDCKTCPLRRACLSEKADRRGIERWEHEEVIERHRARMAAHGAPMMQQRKALAEHPFGTLKCRAGYRHFLMRGFAKVRGELALMVLCYNFTRLLNIMGLERLVEWLATQCFLDVFYLLREVPAAAQRILGECCLAGRQSQPIGDEPLARHSTDRSGVRFAA